MTAKSPDYPSSMDRMQNRSHLNGWNKSSDITAIAIVGNPRIFWVIESPILADFIWEIAAIENEAMGAIQALRGTRDILPAEVGYWQKVEAVVREILGKASYREIRTPIFELTSLFERGIGEATDVVGKEMYSFQSRGKKPYSMTLRPEGTAGVVRAYIEQKLHA
ncbi:MAG: ATP phosphoribosyltransferase regulatory subunit, partial [Chroococcales cyanobacterium]